MGEDSEPKTFREAFKSLINIDCARWSRLAETAQYAAIYAFLSFFVGTGIDALCRHLYPDKGDDKIKTQGQFWGTFGVVLLQVILGAIGVFYIRKLGQLFPLLMNFCPSKYIVSYHVPERVGEIAIALVFVATMGTLLHSVDLMRQYTTGETT